MRVAPGVAVAIQCCDVSTNATADDEAMYTELTKQKLLYIIIIKSNLLDVFQHKNEKKKKMFCKKQKIRFTSNLIRAIASSPVLYLHKFLWYETVAFHAF